MKLFEQMMKVNETERTSLSMWWSPAEASLLTPAGYSANLKQKNETRWVWYFQPLQWHQLELHRCSHITWFCIPAPCNQMMCFQVQLRRAAWVKNLVQGRPKRLWQSVSTWNLKEKAEVRCLPSLLILGFALQAAHPKSWSWPWIYR